VYTISRMIEVMTEMVQNDCGQQVNVECKIGSRAQHWNPWKFFQYSISVKMAICLQSSEKVRRKIGHSFVSCRVHWTILVWTFIGTCNVYVDKTFMYISGGGVVVKYYLIFSKSIRYRYYFTENIGDTDISAIFSIFSLYFPSFHFPSTFED